MAPSKSSSSRVSKVNSTTNTTRKQKRQSVSSKPPKRSTKEEKPQKTIFMGKSICSIGTFKRNDKIVPHQDVARYIKLHGGEWVKEVTDTTTHLICSIEEFGKGDVQVQRAQRLGKRRCHIVVYDWFEDCLLGPKGVTRLIPEKGYTLDRVLIRLQQGKSLTDSFRARFEEGVKASKELVDNKLYHIHYDADGFEYKIILFRNLINNHNGKDILEKYTLYLFESHAIPHVFMVGAKLSRTSRPSSLWRDSCHPMTFPDAFKHFKHFFQEKTSIPWDLRLEPKNAIHNNETSSQPSRRNVGANKGKGKAKAADEEYLAVQAPNPEIDLEVLKFVYMRPPIGRPVGILPRAYILPENRPDYVPERHEWREGKKMIWDQALPSEGGDVIMSGMHANTRLDHSGPMDGLAGNGDSGGAEGYDSDSEVSDGGDGDDENSDEVENGATKMRTKKVSEVPLRNTYFSNTHSTTPMSESGSDSDTESVNSGSSASTTQNLKKRNQCPDSRSGSPACHKRFARPQNKTSNLDAHLQSPIRRTTNNDQQASAYHRTSSRLITRDCVSITTSTAGGSEKENLGYEENDEVRERKMRMQMASNTPGHGLEQTRLDTRPRNANGRLDCSGGNGNMEKIVIDDD